MIAVSNKFTKFVVPNSAKSDSSAHHIFDSAYKAGFLRRVYSIRLALFGDIRGRLASFVIHLTNFFLKMPNSGKVSGTVNNSTRTAPKKYSTLKSEERQSTQHIYKVKFYGVGKWNRSTFGTQADIHFGDIFSATSVFEATGMAIEAVQKEFPQYDIALRSIKCSLLNPLA